MMITNDYRYNAVVREALGKISCLEEKTDGLFHYEFYMDYTDRLEDSEIIRCLDSPNPEERLEEILYEGYEYSQSEIISEIEREVSDALEAEFGDDFDEEERMWLWDTLDDLVCFDYDSIIECYLNQKVNVPIYIDTGDLNTDFSANKDFYEGYDCPEASIIWLARTQGYSETDLRNAFSEETESKFLNSVADEYELTSWMAAVVILAKMTVRDLFTLNMRISETQPKGQYIYYPEQRPDVGSIRISKDAEVGLYDSFNGAGGMFEICLEKDIELPIKLIWSASVDGDSGYGLDDVYGDDAFKWNECVEFDEVEV